MYLPALPTIADDLATTSATVQLTLTGTLVGLALGQLMVGPLSDTFGRRRPLLVGIGVHVLASLLCVVAPNIAVLGGLRVLQGVGAASAAVVTMAIVRDLFTGRAAATLFSRLMLVLGVAPVLAPTLGGEVLRFTSWRGVFVVLAVLALVLLVVAAVAVPETLPPARRRPLGLAHHPAHLPRLLRDRTFVGLVLVAGLAMSGLFGYVAGCSFVFQEQFGLTSSSSGCSSVPERPFPDRRHPAQRRPAAPLRAAGAAAVRPGASTRGGCGLLLLAATGTGGLVGVVVPLWPVLFAVGLACPTRPRWPWPGTARRPAPPPRCSARPRWASARSCRRWSGCSATTRGHGPR